MKVLEIEQEIKRLPDRQRFLLFRRLAQWIEDALDILEHERALKEDSFRPWEEVRKELDAPKHHHRKKSRKISQRTHRRKLTSSSSG